MAQADVLARFGQGTVETLTALADYCDEAALIVAQGESAFLTDRLLQRAAEAIVGRIGETVRHRLPTDLFEDHPGQRWKLIGAQRIRVARRYDSVDYGILWSTLVTSIPELGRYVRETILAP